MTTTRCLSLVLVLLLAFFLRVHGLDFGLPYALHPDESQYVGAGVAFLQDWETLRPQLEKYNNPPLFKTVLGGLYSLITWVTVAPEQMPAALDSLAWRSYLQYVGRFASAACGLLAVAVLYAVARRLYNWHTGVLAALGLAVCFLHVRESHFAVNDAAVTFLVIVGLYGAAGVLRWGRWRDYLGTGLAVGLATATKYSGLQLIAVLPLAHCLHTCRANPGWCARLLSPRLWAGVVTAALGFLAAAPLVVVSWPEMVRRINQLAEYGQLGYHDRLLDAQGSWVFYLEVLGWGAGWLMLGAFVVALVLTVIHRRPEDLLLAVVPVLLYATMASQQMYFARFILPALPPLILLLAAWLVRGAGQPLSALRAWASGRQLLGTARPSPDPRMALTAATLVLFSQSFVTSSWFGILLSQPDTREIAAQWLQANVPQDAIIQFDECALPDELVVGEPEWPYAHVSEPPGDLPDPLVYLQEIRVRYILTADHCTHVRYTDPDQEASRAEWLSDLHAASQPGQGVRMVQEFRPYWLPGDWFWFESRLGPAQETLVRRCAGPLVRIYELHQPAGWHALNPFEDDNQIADVASVYGWETSTVQATAGAALAIAVYWLNHRWKPRYDLVVALVNDGSGEVARDVAVTAPGFEENLERKRRYPVRSDVRMIIPADAPSGAYRMRVSIVDRTVPYTVGETMLRGATVGVVRP